MAQPKWQNLRESLAAIDLITAFGRLVRDGALRDVLAVNPLAVAVQLHVRESDRPSLMQLIPGDLEFQACVLLRKRLDSVRHLLPETFRQLDGDAWPAFHQYARTNWPSGDGSTVRDAFEFCRLLKQRGFSSLCEAEWNRLQFALSEKRLAVQWVRRTNSNRALQVLLRGRSTQWHEVLLYFRI
jgi:hypothetical protein